MKFTIPLIILMIFMGCSIINKQQYSPSKGEQLVNSILAETAKIIQEKYNLKPCGMGAAMPGGPIQGLTLCFDTKFPYTKDQLRELVVKSAQDLLNQVNKNQEIQEFLKEESFTIKNIQIIIYNHDKDGKSLYDPQISNAQILKGMLTYATIDPDDTFKYKNEFEETYEEALRAISKY